MTASDDHRAVVFSDIVGSSQIYATLGNQRAKEKIDQAIELMRDVVAQTGGQVIKTIGDELMFFHGEPEHACDAAVKMNQLLNTMHFHLRTGICYGRVISDRNDLYGDTVNNAAYLASAAQASQILLDSNTFSNLANWRQQCEFFDRVVLKGQSEHSLIYRLNWEQGDTASLDATLMATKAVSLENGIPTQLILHYKEHTYYVDPLSKVFIGRDHGSVQICIRHKNASRKHCSLYYHRGKFILHDHSTNGTYLKQMGQHEVFLRRESTALIANGSISIGQPCQTSEVVLDYHLD